MRIIHLANRHHDEPSAGHGYWLNHAFKSSVEGSGNDFIIVAPKITRDPMARPALQLSQRCRQRVTFLPAFGLRKDLISLAELIEESDEAATFIHVYEGGLRELLMVYELSRRYPKIRGSFNFNLSDPWDSATIRQGSSPRRKWRFVRRMVGSMGPMFTFTAETKELAGLLASNLGVRLEEYPLPALVSNRSNRMGHKEIDFFIPVFEDKELSFVLSSIALLAGDKQADSLRVVIQPRWSGTFSAKSIRECEQLGIQVFPQVLSKEEYENVVAQSKVVILPYSNVEYYQLQSSARMLDSIALGSTVVVPSNTVLSRQVSERGWGLEFDSRSSSSLAETMQKALAGVTGEDAERPLDPSQSLSELIGRTSRALVQDSSLGGKPASSGLLTLRASLLFLKTDFRAAAGGILSFLGVSPSSLRALAQNFPRKQS